jgi:hypothetical protein
MWNSWVQAAEKSQRINSSSIIRKNYAQYNKESQLRAVTDDGYFYDTVIKLVKYFFPDKVVPTV